MTKEAFVLFKNMPGLQYLQQNIMVVLVLATAFLAILVIFSVVSVIRDFMRIEKKEHKVPDSNKLILDLQKTLVKEMRGTATQNWIMIILTVAFIFVTVFGGGTLAMWSNKALKFVMHVFPQFSKAVNNLIIR